MEPGVDDGFPHAAGEGDPSAGPPRDHCGSKPDDKTDGFCLCNTVRPLTIALAQVASARRSPSHSRCWRGSHRTHWGSDAGTGSRPSHRAGSDHASRQSPAGGCPGTCVLVRQTESSHSVMTPALLVNSTAQPVSWLCFSVPHRHQRIRTHEAGAEWLRWRGNHPRAVILQVDPGGSSPALRSADRASPPGPRMTRPGLCVQYLMPSSASCISTRSCQP